MRRLFGRIPRAVEFVGNLVGQIRRLVLDLAPSLGHVVFGRPGRLGALAGHLVEPRLGVVGHALHVFLGGVAEIRQLRRELLEGILDGFRAPACGRRGFVVEVAQLALHLLAIIAQLLKLGLGLLDALGLGGLDLLDLALGLAVAALDRLFHVVGQTLGLGLKGVVQLLGLAREAQLL